MQLTTLTPYTTKEHTMAHAKIPASADFFKQLSQEYEQLRFILYVQESFTFGAAIHGYEPESQLLLYLIEQLDVLISQTQKLKDKVEKRLSGQLS